MYLLAILLLYTPISIDSSSVCAKFQLKCPFCHDTPTLLVITSKHQHLCIRQAGTTDSGYLNQFTPMELHGRSWKWSTSWSNQIAKQQSILPSDDLKTSDEIDLQQYPALR